MAEATAAAEGTSHEADTQDGTRVLGQMEELQRAIKDEWQQFRRGVEESFRLQCERQQLLVMGWLLEQKGADKATPSTAFETSPCASIAENPLAATWASERALAESLGLERASSIDTPESQAFRASPSSAYQSADGSPRREDRRRVRRQDCFSEQDEWAMRSRSPSVLAAMEHGRAPLRVALYQRCARCLDAIADEPLRTGWVARCVDSRAFEAICALVIMLNGAFTVLTTNYEMENPGRGLTPFMATVELVFMCFYTLELILKLIVHRGYFFCNHDMQWNIFDFLLVVLAIYDTLFTEFYSAGDIRSGTNVTFMRVLRILKMAKILRVVRVMRFFAELRLILNSLLGSLASLFWSIVMLALIFYIFALIFVQGSADYIADLLQGDAVRGGCGEQCVRRLFGSVGETMLTLYQSSTSGIDWKEPYEAIESTGLQNAALFIFFIAFIQIALLNILTGIFVENAMKLAQPDRDTLALKHRANEIAQKEELRRMCQEMNGYRDAFKKEDFQQALNHSKYRNYLQIIGLDIKDATLFFDMLASANEGEVDIEDFINGCMRLKGAATSIDMQHLVFETKMMHKLQRQLYEDCMSKFRLLGNAVSRHEAPQKWCPPESPQGKVLQWKLAPSEGWSRAVPAKLPGTAASL
mmetsp:Transcript_21335/g.61685  ORF Transcript_21335/g.61685 Transcript_21335/m.61685 type:complete len:643 (-) Transcript_21335:28-1956(-)